MVYRETDCYSRNQAADGVRCLTILAIPALARTPTLIAAAGYRASVRFLEFFAANIRNPHTRRAKSGKTPVLDEDEARTLLDSIDITTHADLRDRALIALMVDSFARIGAVVSMNVEDVFTQNRRIWVRLREKGGNAHDMPCQWGYTQREPSYPVIL